MDKNTKTVIVFMILLLTLIAIFNLGITGKFWFFRLPVKSTKLIASPTRVVSTSTAIKLISCYDTDHGKDYFTSGYCISGGMTPLHDECSTSSNILREAYCTTKNTCEYQYVNCTKGCSSPGACKK